MSTYLSLHFHVVFATKNRMRYIDEGRRVRLHEYLGGIIRKLGGIPEMIGGTDDHVHLLIGLKATHCLADVMRELKKISSVWIHEELRVERFAWQEGYSAFSVSPTSRPAVSRYIADQIEHHRGRSYRDELIELLIRAGIEYDPKYLD